MPTGTVNALRRPSRRCLAVDVDVRGRAEVGALGGADVGLHVGAEVTSRHRGACGAADGNEHDAASVGARVVVEVDVLNPVVSRALEVLPTALLAMVIAKAAVVQRCPVVG